MAINLPLGRVTETGRRSGIPSVRGHFARWPGNLLFGGLGGGARRTRTGNQLIMGIAQLWLGYRLNLGTRGRAA
jgi:hypothetical protein